MSAATSWPRRHFTPSHPLAGDAYERCLTEHGGGVAAAGLGGVACGRHWEATIRADVRGDRPCAGALSYGPLRAGHPVAAAAMRRCGDVHGYPLQARTGRTACEPCWEAAIRADELWALDYGDPPPPSKTYVDDVVVERAADLGRPLPRRLSLSERAAAAQLLRLRGVPGKVIANHLRMSHAAAAAARAAGVAS